MLKKLIFLPFLLLASLAKASPYYISATTGSDANVCLATAPCNTVKKAQSLMIPGDVLHFLGDVSSPQTYALSSDTFNNTNLSTGSLTTYTTYMAEHDGGVVVSAGVSMLENSTFTLQRHQVFEGFKFSDTNQKQIYGDHIAFKRCGFKDGDPGPSNSAAVVIGGNDAGGNLARYILLEDCWVYGHGGRYKLLVFNSENDILRRVVIKDGGGWSESPSSGNPEAAFALYNSSACEVQDLVLLDGVTTYTEYQQAFYFIHNPSASPDHLVQGNRMRGIMVLDTLNLCIRADAATSTDNLWQDIALADCQNGGLSFGSNSNTTATVDRFGVVKINRAMSGDFMGGIGWFSSGGGITNTNQIISSMTGSDYNGVSGTYFDTYSNGSTSGGVGRVTYNPLTNGWKYPPQIESGSNLGTAGSTGGQIGPNMYYQIGTSGTFWGEVGSSSTLTTAAWPWPNETRIKTDFNEMTPAWGWNASTKTLSTWVWEYFGSSIPAYVYGVDYTSPTVPGTPTVTYITTTTLSIGWSASTDDVAVINYRVDVSTASGFGTFVGTYNNFYKDATGLGGTLLTESNLTPATTYYFRIRAQDAAGNTSGNSGSVNGVTLATIDTSSPSAPTNISTTAVSTDRISFSWSASTDNIGVTGYYEDVSTNSSFSTFVGIYNNNSAGNVLSDTVFGLSPATTYYLRLRAQDLAGNKSNNSSADSGITSILIHAPADISTTTVNVGRMGIFGINFGLYDTTTTMTTEINIATGLGMGRFRSNWDMMDVIHPSSMTWNFTAMDYIVNQLNQKSLRISYYTPWRASWMTADATCRATNPFFGSGATGITQCPTSDLTAYDVFITSMATRYCNSIDTWEVYNEPDLLAATTNTLTYVAIATHTISKVLAVCPGALFSVPALANPRATVFNGNLTDGLTVYNNKCWFGDFLPKFKLALPASITLPSMTYSAHIYYESDGGHLEFNTAISTLAAILAANGVSNPVFNGTEYNLFGGNTPVDSYPAYEIGKSSDAMRVTARALSPSSVNPTVVVKSIIFHNIYGYNFSATTTSYAYRPVAYVLKRLSLLDGYTAQGDQGDGSNVRIYKFTKGSLTTYIAWTESGTYSWALNPSLPVTVTDTTGATATALPGAFTPYTLTSAPIIVEVQSAPSTMTGFTVRGFTINKSP